MRRVDDDADQMIGQDSFLDVVTNIVGILILLVMVVGMRASQAVVSTANTQADPTASAPRIEQPDVETAYRSAAEAEKDVRGMIHRLVDARRETQLREQERELINTIVLNAEREIAARQAKLSIEDQRDFAVRRQLNEAQHTLDELTREQIALISQDPEVEEIECQPTPVVKVVSGKEVHVLLADDHVAIVPFDRAMELLVNDVKENKWRLQQEDVMDRSIGPIDGFRLRYWFVKSEIVARSEMGTFAAGHVSQLSHCVFLPVTTPLGEPAAEALLPNSELHQYLQQSNPRDTTVTVWTYPGNYDRLRELKPVLRELGFQTAVRPLPKGVPIGGSRNGTESLAQ